MLPGKRLVDPSADYWQKQQLVSAQKAETGFVMARRGITLEKEGPCLELSFIGWRIAWSLQMFNASSRR